jgi:hypothetical protein
MEGKAEGSERAREEIGSAFLSSALEKNDFSRHHGGGDYGVSRQSPPSCHVLIGMSWR